MARSNYYFTDETEQSVIKYNLEQDDTVKQTIYTNEIHPSFVKLSEYIINSYQAYQIADTFESAQFMVINHLYDQLPKFSSDRGKAFSFFTFISHTFIWNLLKKNQAYDISHNEISTDFLESNDEYYDHTRRELFGHMISYLDANIFDLFDNLSELLVVEAFLVLFKKHQNLEILNKKALYLQVRELCKIEKSTVITRVVSKLRTLFLHLSKKYKKDGYFNMTYIPDTTILFDTLK